MLLEQDKYQNILSQIHELNRQNLLAEYERNENIIDKLSELEHQIQNKSNESYSNGLVEKLLYGIVFLIIINLILTFFLLFLFYDFSLIKRDSNIIQTKQQVLDIDKESKLDNLTNEQVTVKTGEIDINANIFDEKKYEIEENYTEIKPIIKVDTQYTCEDDNYSKKYKIPYTIEVKGKLYSDKFLFILQNSSERKKCRINKEDI
ncbi:MAG: hypothetical protein PHG81_11250 [Aliarcobacter sp.]|nr:hypothetical protein [Aliarcobacter sp.]